MFDAYDLTKSELVLASHADHRNEYICPRCLERVYLRNGLINVPHYAHYKTSHCSYGHENESETHSKIKKSLFDNLKARSEVEKIKVERNLKTVRPDISCYINQKPVAIEIQVSKIHPDIVVSRLNEYTKMKISMLWIISANNNDKSIQLEKWMFYLKGLQYGRLFLYSYKEYVNEIIIGDRLDKYYWSIVRSDLKNLVDDFDRRFRHEYYGYAYYPKGFLWLPRSLLF